MSYLLGAERRLSEIRNAHRLRSIATRIVPAGDFASNDYLGLAVDPRVIAALAGASRVGSGGSRLLSGHHPEHARFEEAIATYTRREAALLFSSGYLAVAGAIAVLSPLVEAAYSDERNHASIIDALRLTKSVRTIYRHGLLPPRYERIAPALIVTESVFGMDGDAVHIAALVADLNDGDILLVDEAHALGVRGPCGAGLAAQSTDLRIVVVGTLSKALGAHGGFIAGPRAVIDLLINTARTFIFDTALPPAIIAAASAALALAAVEEGRRTALTANVARVRTGLTRLRVPAAPSAAAIVSVVLGEERRALEVAQRLLERGISAPAIRPPTVPPGTSRLRLSIRADHTPAEIDALLDGLACIDFS